MYIMPSCLGVYIEKNLIKYAKVSKDRATSELKVDSFGLKFYDNLSHTIASIIKETDSESDLIAVNLSNENYNYFNVFNKLSYKDIKQLLETEFESYCAEKGIPVNLIDMRYILVKKTDEKDTYKAICVSANKAELTNLWQTFIGNKLESISPIGVSIGNLLDEFLKKQNCAIVNIEDVTKVTVFHDGEIAHIETISIGMNDVISRVADMYNSYSKAYEACKSVSVYVSDGYDVEDGTQDILNLLLPAFYDLRQRVSTVLKPYIENVNKIYVTGMGVIINNIDLYFQEYFENITCEILKPYFVEKDASNLKDIVEVNSAIAIALNSLLGVDRQTDFFTGLHGYLKTEAIKKKLMEFSAKDAYDKLSIWVSGLGDKIKKTTSSGFTKKNKPAISFADEVEELDRLDSEADAENRGGEAPSERKKIPELPVDYYDSVDAWLVRLSLTLVIGLAAYSGVSIYTQRMIDDKTNLTDTRIADVTQKISAAQSDVDYIAMQADDYKAKTDKLSKIIESIRIRTERSFDIPNFMSQLMFVIPEDVKVTSINVEDGRSVILEAESGKYNQLGYFVSKLKLEEILDNVNMEVVSMNSNIKIKVNGELP